MSDKQFWTFLIGGTIAFLVCVPSILRWWRSERDRRRMETRAKRFPRRAADPSVPAVDLVRLFGGPATWTTGMLAPARSDVVRLAELAVPSGRIVACDPLVGTDTPAFVRQVPPGTYPVDVVNLVPDTGGPAYAALRITFASGTPTRWELADTDAVGGDVGYPVDAGIGCVMSVEAQTLLRAEMDRIGDDYYDTVIAPKLDEWLDYRPDAERPENVVMVQSGAGDGIYPCYWGLDDDGRVLWFVTDFQLVR